MKFLVWRESDDEKSAKVREADDAEEAARDFADQTWTSDDDADTMHIVVRDHNGVVFDVEIGIDWDPMFHVDRVTTRDPDDDRPTQPQDTVVVDVPHEGAL